MLKTFFFVYVGLSIPFSDFHSIMIGAIVTLALFGVRVIVAKFFSPSSANSFDKSAISVMIPKGLAAAVLASVPEQLGLPGGESIKYITFSVVLFSILLCSILILLIERYPRFAVAMQFVFRQKGGFSKKSKTNNPNPSDKTANQTTETPKELNETAEELDETPEKTDII